VSVPWQPTPAADLKRSRSMSPDVEPQPQPLPTRALPEGLWEDHLLPVLTRKDAARLGRSGKALRVVVREHFKDLGDMRLERLQEALTAFPRARSVGLYHFSGLWGAAESEALVEWLRERGHGAGITMMGVTMIGAASLSDVVIDFIHAALRGGALPSLQGVTASLERDAHRALLTEGHLGGMRELRLMVVCTEALEPQLAALGAVRDLPALTELHISVRPGSHDAEAQWPPFTPPSVKKLRIVTREGPIGRSLLCALPRLLGASGASLDCLEVEIPYLFDHLGEELVHLAQALRCCAPTLRDFRLETDCAGLILFDVESFQFPSQVGRLRVQWAHLLAGVSACRELEVLVLPSVMVDTWFPPGTAFPRLTHLEISEQERGHPPGAGVMGLWELMASGGLPALAKLSVQFEDLCRGMAPALEAVAGTLTHLRLQGGGFNDDYDADTDWVDVGYHVGVAVGKLRRLKDLALDLSGDGRAYHAVSQGLAASGGGHPLPLLWRVRVVPEVTANADLLASLLLPSVRVFVSSSHKESEAALTACALRQAGYKHVWTVKCPPALRDAVRAMSNCALGDVEGQKWFVKFPFW
jgi:hypothetical protein